MRRGASLQSCPTTCQDHGGGVGKWRHGEKKPQETPGQFDRQTAGSANGSSSETMGYSHVADRAKTAGHVVCSTRIAPSLVLFGERSWRCIQITRQAFTSWSSLPSPSTEPTPGRKNSATDRVPLSSSKPPVGDNFTAMSIGELTPSGCGYVPRTAIRRYCGRFVGTGLQVSNSIKTVTPVTSSWLPISPMGQQSRARFQHRGIR